MRRCDHPMPDIIAARAQMGMSLAFHIVFACVGVAIRRQKTIEWVHVRHEESGGVCRGRRCSRHRRARRLRG